MKRNYQELLEQAKEGRELPYETLEAIRSQLSSGDFEYDPYTLLHILGKAGDLSSLPIVRKYLNYDSDDMLRRISLQVIGRMWALAEAFEVALDKAFEDPSKDVRAAAATIIGFLGSKYPEFKVRSAAALLRGFDSERNVDRYVWESFYDGLLELFEIPPREWPSPLRDLSDTDIRSDLIEKARTLATL